MKTGELKVVQAALWAPSTYYRIREYVGEHNGVALTIDWPGLYTTKAAARKAIKRGY